MFTKPNKIRVPGPAQFDNQPPPFFKRIMKFVARRANSFFEWCEGLNGEMVSSTLSGIFVFFAFHLLPALVWYLVEHNDRAIVPVISPHSFAYTYFHSVLWSLNIIGWILVWVGSITFILWILVVVLRKFRKWCREYSK